MSDMTPEQARAELQASLSTRTYAYLYDLARRALETIAADALEYGVAADYNRYGEGEGLVWDDVTEEEWGTRAWAEQLMEKCLETEATTPGAVPAVHRLVARRVSTPWEVTE